MDFHAATMKLASFTRFVLLIALFMMPPSFEASVSTWSSPSSSLSETLESSPSDPWCEFPAIFNFGDSNSDTGGSSAAFGQIGTPHGMTFFHAPAGRYCDGRLIIDFIAEKLGLPYLSAFLDSVGSNFSHGVNFATAGSTIRHQNTTNYSPFSFNVQFRQFNDFQQRSQTIITRKGGSVCNERLPSKEYFSEALYTFDIGQNDLTAAYFPSMSIDQAKSSIPDILCQFKTYVKNIYDHGARYFWIHNTGPLGCLAYVLSNPKFNNATQLDQFGCSIELNELAQYFNFGLKQIVAQLRGDMPGAAITYVDVYSAKYALISQANQFGFEEPLKACCGHGGGKYNYDMKVGCGAKAMVNGTEILTGGPCKDPTVKINWDGAHYTEAANKWVFDRIVNGSYSDPPTPLKMACYKS